MADASRLTIRLPEELAEAIKKEAQKQGLSVNAFVLLLINEELNLRKLESHH